MSRAIKDSAATRSLRTRVELKSTGKLTVGAGPAEVAVHLLHGDILAATTPDDDRQVVHLLHLLGVVDDSRAEDLESRAEGGGDVLGDVLELGLGAVVDDVLRERFVQNLCDFVTSASTPRFTEQKGVFVTNIQMGHDTLAVVDEACRLSDLAKAVDLGTLVVRGRMPPGTHPARLAIADCLGTDPRTVSSLLHEVALEPTRARVVLGELLLDGVAAPFHEGPGDDTPLEEDETVSSEWPTRPLPSHPTPPPPPPPQRAEPVRPSTSTLPPVPEPPRRIETAKPEPSKPELAKPPEPPKRPNAMKLPEPEPEPEELPAEELEELLPDDDGATMDAEIRPEPSPPEDPIEPQPTLTPDDWSPEADMPAPQQGVPSSLSAWMAGSATVGEEELDFFSDHDYDRGSDDKGAFKTDTHNLDKVEVAEMNDAEEAIEADEAPSGRFGAPVISEDEALAKIEVANEVLAVILGAFDEAEGHGRGRAVLQLLVDGAPNQYAALLYDLRIADDSALPSRILIRNLASRPPTEHRLLLNNGLADIIDRALSSAADDLPDEQIDAVLEAVAGYRARLGL